ncbi:HD domain-containing protein, partial [bacterium]|nr:HD domain-containing protein [bacterium]
KSYQDELKDQNKILDRKVKESTAELEESRLDIILRLGKAAEYRDEETGNHILRVGCYCRALAEELDMACNFVEMIFLTSPLHDIGKIGIPDKILLKSGELTPAERKIMERHCIIGADILRKDTESMNPYLKWHRNKSTLKSRDNFILDMASTITLYHHEKWDGSGHPTGKKGEDISTLSQIIQLAETYVSLLHHRKHRSALTREDVLRIIDEEKGKAFDPKIVEAFEEVLQSDL